VVAGPLSSIFNGAKTTRAWTTRKGEAGADFTTISSWPPSPACLSFGIICAVKKTSGLTWEQALRAMQPLVARSRGLCPCCRTELADFLPVYT
jgi:hypothetical protein